MKIFRWGGLIGFVIVVALLSVVGYFFIDRWAKKGIESAGFQINNAEVDVGTVRLSLNPIGFSLRDVQIADAQKPTHNALVLDEVTLDMNFPQLFLGNVRINDLTIGGIESNVQRQREARVKKPKTQEEAASGNFVQDKVEQVVDTANSNLPTPADAVNSQIENTKAAIEHAQQTVSASKQSVENAAAELPTDSDLSEYKKRIEAIKALKLDSLTAIQNAQSMIASVSADVAQDKLAVEKAKLSVTNAVSDSKDAVAQIAKAPAKDWQALVEQYPFNKEGALQVAKLFLGDDFFDRIEQAQQWYEKARPWLAKLKSEDEADAPERASGEYIRFPHPDPTAAFQVDHGQLSFVADNWPWQLTIDDLSSHTGNFFKPTQLLLQRGTDERAALKITGLLDKHNGQPRDTFEVAGRGVSFAQQSFELAGSQISWVPEPANVVGQIVSTSGELNGNVSLQFPSNELTVTGSGQITNYLAQALATIDAFQIDIGVSGTVTRPKFKVTSDIDNRFSSAMSDVARAEYDAWLKDARAQLEARVNKLRAPADDALVSLNGQRDRVERRIDAFETEVEQEINALQAKAEQELSSVRKKIDAEKKAAEDAATKAAQEKTKDELNKLKDKIKF